MTATALANHIVPQKRASKSRLFRRLSASATQDAADATHDFCLDIIAATLYSPTRVQRMGGTAFLLFLDAINDRRPGKSRELRWRRFIRALAKLAENIDSAAIAAMVRENADLL